MEQIQENLRLLTGAVNAQIEQQRGLSVRLDQIETRINQPHTLLEQLNNRLQQLEARTISPQAETATLTAPVTEQDLSDTKKLPDSVKDLPVFDGNPTQYISWVHQVETILGDHAIVRAKPIYRAILHHIRRKVRGQADQALISYNIFNQDWPEIKNCLSLHYADKRDIRTLEFELGSLFQGKLSVDEFYAKVNHQLSLIVNKEKTESHSKETVDALIEGHRNRALDVFIRGLRGEVSKMLKFQKPKTLPEAYAACLDFQNVNYRDHTLHTKGIYNTISAPINQMTYDNRQTQPPPRPDRKTYNVTNQITPREQNQIYNYVKKPYFNNAPPRPTQPKPPIPMDIDPSLRSARINYMNKPSPMIKMSNESSNIPRKYQKMFNTETAEEEAAEEEYIAQIEEDYDQEDGEDEAELNFMTDASLAYHT